jgi:hypothetical protein
MFVGFFDLFTEEKLKASFIFVFLGLYSSLIEQSLNISSILQSVFIFQLLISLLKREFYFLTESKSNASLIYFLTTFEIELII